MTSTCDVGIVGGVNWQSSANLFFFFQYGRWWLIKAGPIYWQGFSCSRAIRVTTSRDIDQNWEIHLPAIRPPPPWNGTVIVMRSLVLSFVATAAALVALASGNPLFYDRYVEEVWYIVRTEEN